jgi:hypothetical protein
MRRPPTLRIATRLLVLVGIFLAKPLSLEALSLKLREVLDG